MHSFETKWPVWRLFCAMIKSKDAFEDFFFYWQWIWTNRNEYKIRIEITYLRHVRIRYRHLRRCIFLSGIKRGISIKRYLNNSTTLYMYKIFNRKDVYEQMLNNYKFSRPIFYFGHSNSLRSISIHAVSSDAHYIGLSNVNSKSLRFI